MPGEVNILLVEDESPKRTHIERLLTELAPLAKIIVARSVNSALSSLEEEVVNLLLLDMSLPTFDVGERESGGRPQGFGGIEILRYMELSEFACPTIIITGYEGFTEGGKTVELAQLKRELYEEFPEILRGVLHYNSTYDEWRTTLGQTLLDLGFTGKRE